jgi:hypothetical protein
VQVHHGPGLVQLAGLLHCCWVVLLLRGRLQFRPELVEELLLLLLGQVHAAAVLQLQVVHAVKHRLLLLVLFLILQEERAVAGGR